MGVPPPPLGTRNHKAKTLETILMNNIVECKLTQTILETRVQIKPKLFLPSRVSIVIFHFRLFLAVWCCLDEQLDIRIRCVNLKTKAIKIIHESSAGISQATNQTASHVERNSCSSGALNEPFCKNVLFYSK